MFHNIIIGTPLVEPWMLISSSKEEFDCFDSKDTLFTSTRFLPKILVQAGVVKSKSEVKRNKPEFNITLNNIDCQIVKWGKHKLFIVIGK